MKLKKLLTFSLIILILVISACSNDSSGDEDNVDPNNMLIGTSSQGGTYYVWGGGWSDIMGDNVSDVNIGVEVTGGPTDNMKLIQNGEMELGFVTSWLGGEGYNGEGWADKEYDKMRSLFVMYPSVMHMYSLKENGIKNIQDFEGEHITTGSPGSTSEIAGEDLMNILDIEPKEISKVPTDTSVDNLRDGQVDAGFAVTGVPGPFMLDLETTKEVQHISLTDEEIDKILGEQPYWDSIDVPEGTYKHQDDDLQLVSFWNLAIATKDLSEDLAYELTKQTFENQEQLINVDPTAEDTEPDLIENTTIPIHPGALKYYKEEGIEVPDELIPPESK